MAANAEYQQVRDMQLGRRLDRRWLAPCAFMVVLGLTLYEMTAAFSATHTAVLYPLDDSYIHLALARTLSQTGVWGIDPQHPAAASSSPLWTLILTAIFKLVPDTGAAALSWAPLVCNALLGIALVALWGRLLARVNTPTLAVLLLVAIVPVASIALIGMEHLLHALLATLLGWSAARALNQEGRLSIKQLVGLGALAALATATRYESLALITAISLLSVLRRRWILIPAVTVPAALVVGGFGLIWMRSGGWLVPNSLLLKVAGASAHGGTDRLARSFVNVYLNATSPVGWLMIALSCGLLACRLALGRRQTPEGTFAVIAALCTLAQFFFGTFNWLYRYEAWLVALDGLALLLAANALLADRLGFIGVLGLLALACAPRAYASTTETIMAAHDREWEHFGPAYALGALGRQPILINDVGVIGYFGSTVPVDVYGLANNAALRMRRRNAILNSADVANFAKAEGAHFAEVQICWPDGYGPFPSGWQLVEAWIGPRNIVFSDRTVGFLADSPKNAKLLETALLEYPVPTGVMRMPASSPQISQFNDNIEKRQLAEEICPVMAHRK